MIDEGQLTSYLYDLARARQDDMPSTGNGRRAELPPPADPAYDQHLHRARRRRPGGLIADVDAGLYAVSFGGGQVEPATGDFVFGVSEGYLIENGKVTAPVPRRDADRQRPRGPGADRRGRHATSR